MRNARTRLHARTRLLRSHRPQQNVPPAQHHQPSHQLPPQRSQPQLDPFPPIGHRHPSLPTLGKSFAPYSSRHPQTLAHNRPTMDPLPHLQPRTCSAMSLTTPQPNHHRHLLPPPVRAPRMCPPATPVSSPLKSLPPCQSTTEPHYSTNPTPKSLP